MSDLFVLAWIGDQQVAFDATRVEAVVDITMVVPVPLAAPHVLGLAAIRSQVITVIDCSAVVAAEPVAPTGRAIVTAIDGHRYALRVDRVEDVVSGLVRPGDACVPLGREWSAIANGILEAGDGFAVVVDPARLVAAAPITIAA